MSKVLLGMVSFGNTMFTAKALESCRETCEHQLDYFVVVGKPNDNSTINMLTERKIPFIVHQENKGFPASVNDIYDYGFREHDYDSIIFAGNDIVAYPYALDNLIKVAENSNIVAISAEEVNVKDIVNFYPDTRKYFTGSNYVTTDLSHKAWELFKGYTSDIHVTNEKGIIDIHNLCLYKRELFEKLGYIDVNFYPAYFEDNDYVRRMATLGLPNVTINSKYFHFWSRTLHQESGGSNSKYFRYNQAFYGVKWGGLPNNETYYLPFNNKPFTLVQGLELQPLVNIQSRELEPHIINFWKSKK